MRLDGRKGIQPVTLVWLIKYSEFKAYFLAPLEKNIKGRKTNTHTHTHTHTQVIFGVPALQPLNPFDSIMINTKQFHLQVLLKQKNLDKENLEGSNFD